MGLRQYSLRDIGYRANKVYIQPRQTPGICLQYRIVQPREREKIVEKSCCDTISCTDTVSVIRSIDLRIAAKILLEFFGMDALGIIRVRAMCESAKVVRSEPSLLGKLIFLCSSEQLLSSLVS